MHEGLSFGLGISSLIRKQRSLLHCHYKMRPLISFLKKRFYFKFSFLRSSTASENKAKYPHKKYITGTWVEPYVPCD